MSVIEQRLRLHADNKTKQAMQRDCQLAADEIESLRELLRIVRAERDELAAKHYASMAEIARLRVWVEEAVNYYVGCETWSPSLKAEGEALLREDAA